MINLIVVHCSASPQGRGDNAATIHKWHLDRGWSGIGYHHVILEDGTLEPGRPPYWTGAHCRGHNTDSVGICLIGMGGDATNRQLSTLLDIIKTYRLINEDAEVLGHCDLDSNKTCPGFDVRAWLNEV